MKKTDIKKIKQALNKAKKQIIVGVLVLALVIAGLLFLIIYVAKPPLIGDVFYYKGEGENSKLFSLRADNMPQHLITLPSEEVDTENFKVPKHSYISHNGQIMIFFERTEEIPIGVVSEERGLMAYRIVYRPNYVDLKTGTVKEIEQEIDSGSVVFSSNDNKIAWILMVEEATVEALESAQKKREVWLSNSDGSDAEQLAVLDEKVILLQTWDNNHIYFWGIQGVGYYSLGRIDVANGKVEYARPKYCSEKLRNCQNFGFSPSGQLFLYEAGIEKDSKESIELFVESFDGKQSWQILVNNYISERLWLADESHIIYTEQVPRKKNTIEEKIHLVNLRTKEDKEIYSGNYISQIVPDKTGEYLYFIEKETDEKFNLNRLNVETGEAEIIDFGEYYQLKIFSSEI